MTPKLAPKELLRPARPVRLVAYALANWIVIAAIWTVCLYTRKWFYPIFYPVVYPICVLLLAGRLHALGVVLHDAAHMPGSRKTVSVRVLEILAGYPVGSTLEAMRYHHLRHHRDLSLPTDPYLKPWVGSSRLRLWLMSLRYFLLVPLWILRGPYGALAAYMPALRSSYGHLFLQDRSVEDLTHSPEVIACAREERWQTAFHAGVLAIALRWPDAVLLFFITPLFFAGYLAGYRLLHEHAQELDENRERSMQATIRLTHNHHLGVLGRILVAPHNVGYHLAHHLHPQASFESLPKLQAWYDEHGGAKAWVS